MRITYDPEADAVYIKLRSGHAADAMDLMDLEEGITADLDDEGRVIGIEILNASRRLGTRAVERIDFEHLTGPRRRAAPAVAAP